MPFTDSRSQNCTAPILRLLEVEGRDSGSPSGWMCVHLFQQPADGSHLKSNFFCQKAIEEATWATPSLDKAETLQDTRSCVVPRPSDESNDTESSRRVSKKFFYVYVENLGVLGTSCVNVDEDLMMAYTTVKSRGLDTHEEIAHSNRATALGIHIDLRNMLVSGV